MKVNFVVRAMCVDCLLQYYIPHAYVSSITPNTQYKTVFYRDPSSDTITTAKLNEVQNTELSWNAHDKPSAMVQIVYWIWANTLSKRWNLNVSNSTVWEFPNVKTEIGNIWI